MHILYINNKTEHINNKECIEKLSLIKNKSNIKSIHINKYNINEVPEDIFIDMEKINRVCLCNMGIKLLHKNTFSSLKCLMILNLSHNNLTSLPEDIFINLPKLQQLFLSYNKLNYLPEKIFKHLNNLEILFLNNNNIVKLPDNIFNELENLNYLYLHNNNLENLPLSIMSLYLISYSVKNNKLNKINPIIEKWLIC